MLCSGLKGTDAADRDGGGGGGVGGGDSGGSDTLAFNFDEARLPLL